MYGFLLTAAVGCVFALVAKLDTRGAATTMAASPASMASENRLTHVLSDVRNEPSGAAPNACRVTHDEANSAVAPRHSDCPNTPIRPVRVETEAANGLAS